MRLIRRMAAALFCVLLISALPACGADRYEAGEPPAYETEEKVRAAYEEGYAAGYLDGLEDGRLSAGIDLEQPDTNSEPEALDSSGFVMLSEAVPDAILEIRYYSTYNFMGERAAGYEEPVALLTKEAAAALKEVSDELLEQGYRLKIYDAYRPQTAVDQFKAWSLDLEDTRMKAYFYPELEKSVLFEQGYIASKSGHSRGSTVDLTLFDMDSGKDVDMGGTFDYFGERSHSDYTAGLTEEQVEHRKLLKEVMLAHGFKSISTEWWHFTLRDEPYPSTYFDFPVKSLR